MNDWLVKMAQKDPLPEEALERALRDLPPEELRKLAFDEGITLLPQTEVMAEKVASALRIGQQLAQEHGSELLEKAAFALPAGLGSLAQKAVGAAVRRPGLAMGAAGAAAGAVMAPRDPQTGQKQVLKGALTGGALGYGASKIPLGGGQSVGSALRRQVVGKPAVFGQGVADYARKATKASAGPSLLSGATEVKPPMGFKPSAGATAGPKAAATPPPVPAAARQVPHGADIPVSLGGSSAQPKMHNSGGSDLGSLVAQSHGVRPTPGTPKESPQQLLAGLRPTASAAAPGESVRQLVSGLRPKTASVGLMKLAMGLSMGPDGEHTWLDQFKGTPLAQKAIQLEEQALELEKIEMAKRHEEQQEYASREVERSQQAPLWQKRDMICLAKRELALELAKHEAGGGQEEMSPPPMEEAPVAPPVPEGEPAMAQTSPVEQIKQAMAQKIAKEWETKEVHHRIMAPHHEQERKSQETGRKWGARLGAPVGAVGGVMGGRHGISALERRVGEKMPGKLKIPATAAAALLGSQFGGVAGRGVGGSIGRTVGVARGPGEKSHLNKEAVATKLGFAVTEKLTPSSFEHDGDSTSFGKTKVKRKK